MSSIQRIELFHIAIPLKKSFETSFGVVDRRPALLFKLTTDDGFVGYGESSPLYTPISEAETLADGLVYLKQMLPSLIGLSVDESFDISSAYAFKKYPTSTIGIEAAYADILSQQRGVPLRQYWGGSKKTVQVGESAGIHASEDEVVEDVRLYLNQGYERVKIKIAPGHDIEIVDRVRREFPSLALGVDANAAYHPTDIDHLKKLLPYRLLFIEQPFRAEDDEAHAALQKGGLPVALDESVVDLASCRRVVENNSCRFINIKPARIGSFAEARRIHDYCVQQGIGLFGGGRMETGVGKTANAHFYALPGFTDASDLTPPLEYFAYDIIDPAFKASAGFYTLPTTPGLGVGVNEKKLSAALQDHYVFGD